jgi:type I restriction enzyme S subunit
MLELPASAWEQVKVADVIERHFCGPSPDCEERPVFDDAEWGVLKTTAITWSGWNQDAHKVLPRSYWGWESIEVKAGDVLVTKAGPRHRVAVVTHIPATRRQLVVSGKMIGLRPRVDLVLPEVLAGLLALHAPQKYINDRTTGMAESQVNFANDVLLDTPLRLPPKAEQTEIARIAGALDATIRQTEAIIEKLKQVKQGLLHDLLTRGIDANGELRPPQGQAPHLYKDSPLGCTPVGWSDLALDELVAAPICYGIVQVFEFVPDGVPVLAIKDLLGDFANGVHRTAKSIDAGYSRSRVQPDDVLVSIKGTIGRIGIVPSSYVGNISRDIARLRPCSMIRPDFFVQLLRSPIGQRILALAQVGTTRAELSIAPLRKLRFAVPTVDEQEQVEAVLRAHDARIDAENRTLLKLKHQKAGLMDDLLTGRVRVTALMGQGSRA